MPKPRAKDGRKNLIGVQLKILRREAGMSTRDLATQLQLNGVDIDRNVKYSLQGTTQGNGLTGGVPPVRFSM